MISDIEFIDLGIMLTEQALKIYREEYDYAFEHGMVHDANTLKSHVIKLANKLCELLTKRNLLLMTEPTTEAALTMLNIDFEVKEGLIFITPQL